MKELLEKVNESFAAFIEDANLQIEKNNKAAGTRARKASLEIEKMMKGFRKASLEASKQ
ncbi:histone H1 [uncultured Bacteroides sp.]|uniref:histone H1 n=1 Tax=uncultured Bacteroides sp. TaxID=162156 RepID=UPI0025E11DC7|nr:histone H1 [uncultured Bacteroides sp.]